MPFIEERCAWNHGSWELASCSQYSKTTWGVGGAPFNLLLHLMLPRNISFLVTESFDFSAKSTMVNTNSLAFMKQCNTSRYQQPKFKSKHNLKKKITCCIFLSLLVVFLFFKSSSRRSDILNINKIFHNFSVQ